MACLAGARRFQCVAWRTGAVGGGMDQPEQRPKQPFAYRDYRLFWIGRLCSTLAQNAMVVVIGWQAYDIARLTMGTKQAALQLGLIALAQFLPIFALTLITGWTADRVDRRVIGRLCSALQLVCAGML